MRRSSPPARALMIETASGVTARGASRSARPSATSTRLALGESCSPAPTSSSRSAFSSTTMRKPRAASASAAVSPPIPAPAMTIVGERATPDREKPSGRLVLHDAFRRTGFTRLQIGGEAVQRRAVGADDLVVIAEVEEDVRMIERRIGAHAHELLRADLDDGDTGIVVEVRDDMVGHRNSSWSGNGGRRNHG